MLVHNALAKKFPDSLGFLLGGERHCWSKVRVFCKSTVTYRDHKNNHVSDNTVSRVRSFGILIQNLCSRICRIMIHQRNGLIQFLDYDSSVPLIYHDNSDLGP